MYLLLEIKDNYDYLTQIVFFFKLNYLLTFRLPTSTKYATDPAINSHMFFTTRDPQANYSTLGKGYRGGACDAQLMYHALLMEYENDDITFARVIG